MPKGRLDSIVPAILPVLVVVGWEVSVRFFDLPRYILPTPSSIIIDLRGEWQDLMQHTWITLREAFLGYVIGNGTAIVLAALMAEFRLVERGVYPYLITLRSVPVTAAAPLLIIWFGFSIWPMVGAAALLSFFPTLVNCIDGFKRTDPTALELMRGLNARRWKTFWYVKWPFALPFMFAGLKITIAPALIGAVVGEWIASDAGLGYLTILANNFVDTILLFQALMALTLVSLAWFLVVTLVESRVVRWSRA